MIEVRFKNMTKSEMISNVVLERVGYMIEKFPDLNLSKILVTIEMQNSPVQAGPDLFKVKLVVSRGRYGGIVVDKEDPLLYVAFAKVLDKMLERLNRFGDKVRVKRISQARSIQRNFKMKNFDTNSLDLVS